ncbi:hypothetical protein GCM10009069_17520 [Algimonas arctica]|uniref:Uncharacterized protein n=1 Tax=Algimonas arctica TaxID=1479486 RepID=A0A8J3G2K6_9PROT|nr:hypothetical protein [Algimonas arctica]GHA95019.1 hypothetical protein GCM10009069_17520 [Algimonas arctica]
MKFVAQLSAISLFIALTACNPAAPESERDISIKDVTNPTVDIIETGGDRDSHGCIPSAGYTWSEALEECVRLFEVGIPLENMQDLESPSIAYLIVGSSDQIELFRPNGDTVQLFKSEADVWQDTDKIYTVKLNTPAQYTVFKDGRTLFFEDRYVPNPLNAGEYEDLGDADPDDILTETGILTAVEDGPYPFYSITLEFPKREMRASFTLNVEAVAVDTNALYTHLNETISVNYTSDLVLNIVEVELESGFLYGTENREELRDYKSASGIMQEASVTMGDLPGTFYLEDAEDNRTYFEEFVTDELVAGNGRQVTVYYDERAMNNITSLDLGEK